MQQQNPPSKHHYIPAFYLSRWEGGLDSKLIEFTKPYGPSLKVKPAKAVSTGFLEGLYSLEGYEPKLAQQVETEFFAPIDNEASKALGLLEQYGHRAPWDSGSRSAWTRFLLSLLLRCPEDIEALRKWYSTEVFGNPGPEEEAQYRSVRVSDDHVTFAEYLRNLPVQMKERTQFQTLCGLIDHEAIGAGVNQMEWRVLETPASAPSLLTSDRPVIRSTSLRGTGAHIALPIGPRHIFFASPDPSVLIAIAQSNQIELVKKFNHCVVGAASRFVYGCDESQLRFVKNNFGSNQQPRTIESMFNKLRNASLYQRATLEA